MVLAGCGKKPTSGTVSGILKWKDGAAISGAQVLIGEKSATSGANGAYSISDVPFGEHSAQVIFDGDLVHTQDVVIEKKAVTADMDIAAPLYGSVSGIVLKKDDAPLVNALVKIGSRTATTDATGAYTVPKVIYGSHEAAIEYFGGDIFSADVTVNGATNTLDMQLTQIGNVLVYEGFEGLSGTQLPANWSASGNAGQSSTEEAFAGVRSWELPATNVNHGILTYQVPVTPGRTYMLTAQCILPRTSRFYFYFYDAAGTRLPDALGSPFGQLYTTNGVWAERSFSTVAPEGAAGVVGMFYFYRNTSAEPSVGYFDEAQIIELY